MKQKILKNCMKKSVESKVYEKSSINGMFLEGLFLVLFYCVVVHNNDDWIYL